MKGRRSSGERSESLRPEGIEGRGSRERVLVSLVARLGRNGSRGALDVLCDKPQCIAGRVTVRLRKTTQRIDGVVLRVYACPRCRRVLRSLEWPEGLLLGRFEVLRKERRLERERLMRRLGGGSAMERCLKALKSALIEVETAKEGIRREADCGQETPEYDDRSVGVHQTNNVL